MVWSCSIASWECPASNALLSTTRGVPASVGDFAGVAESALSICCTGRALKDIPLAVVAHLRLLIICDADFANQFELRFQPVDVLLLRREDGAEKVAADVVAQCFAFSNRGLEGGVGDELELEVALQNFLDGFADQQLVQVLEIRQ